MHDRSELRTLHDLTNREPRRRELARLPNWTDTAFWGPEKAKQTVNQPNETPTLDGTFPRKGLGNPDHLDSFPNETLETIFSRRTIRRFTDEPIAPETLDLIVDAGLRAPNGGACQAVIMLVSQDAEVNRNLGRISLQMYKDGYYHVSDAQPSAADDLSMKDGFYGAPVSITVFTPSIWDVGQFDAAMSIENMTLAAWSLGIGSCCVARAKETFETGYGMEVRHAAGIPDDYDAQLHLVLGHPKSTARDHRELYPNRVAWI